MKNTPLVTIITSTFNAVSELENSIKSVIAQSYPNVEYIIIDGGSTDGTLEIIKKYEKNISIIISEKDNGIYDAWNKDLSLATGDWIAFLGADDEYLPDAILNYVNHIEKLNIDDLDYVSSKVELINSNNKFIRVIGSPWNWKKFKRYKCKCCNYHYSVEKKSKLKSDETKRLVLEMYLERLGLRFIGRVLKISHGTVLNWIRD